MVILEGLKVEDDKMRRIGRRKGKIWMEVILSGSRG